MMDWTEESSPITGGIESERAEPDGPVRILKGFHNFFDRNVENIPFFILFTDGGNFKNMKK